MDVPSRVVNLTEKWQAKFGEPSDELRASDKVLAEVFVPGILA